MLYPGVTTVPGLHYISDGASPVVSGLTAEQSLVAHYSDESKYKQYLKPLGHLCGPLWMPFWEPDELEALRAKHSLRERSPRRRQGILFPVRRPHNCAIARIKYSAALFSLW